MRTKQQRPVVKKSLPTRSCHKGLIKGMYKHCDKRGAYYLPKTLDDACWGIEDALLTNAMHSQMFTLMSKALTELQEQIDGLRMDKQIHQVTKRIKTAEKDVRKGKKKAAVKVLKKAATKNEKLKVIDRDERDPLIKKCKASMKSGMPMKKSASRKR